MCASAGATFVILSAIWRCKVSLHSFYVSVERILISRIASHASKYLIAVILRSGLSRRSAHPPLFEGKENFIP